jgi:hypothetical protein
VELSSHQMKICNHIMKIWLHNLEILFAENYFTVPNFFANSSNSFVKR